MTRIYVIAGEASGDVIGARLITALQGLAPSCEITGIGGLRMQKAGLKSLFPMEDISLMGFAEILPHLPTVLCRIRQTVQHIKAYQPDIIVTIDSPGFCRRVVKALQHERHQGMRCIHYVAPTVWAYRPERVRKFAALYDAMLCLLPMEPAYFAEAGLQAQWVGHPVLEESATGDAVAFRLHHQLDDAAPLLTMLPGSRQGELGRLLPVYAEVAEQLLRRIPGLTVAILAAGNLEASIHGHVEHWPCQPLIVSQAEKADLLAATTAALSKSGTVTLELALADVPMVVTHKVSASSARLMRRMIQIRFVTLANILNGYEVVPELLQEFCRSDMLLNELLPLLHHDSAASERQCAGFAGLRQQLMGARPDMPPSMQAARVILQLTDT